MMVHENDIQVAVVTGGHGYDVKNFHKLFQSLTGIQAYIQHMDDFASSPEAVRDSYNVVLFYTMLVDTPVDEGLPWYAGRPKTALEHLGATGQGIFLLHHSLLAFPKWPRWSEMVGIKERSFGFHQNETLKVQTAHHHPIVQNLSDWEMMDESYTMHEPDSDSQAILITDHPKSMKTIAWTRQLQNSRVFCFQSGHDNITWANPCFKQILQRGIEWCAGLP